MTYKEALHRLTNTLCEGCNIKNPTECSICHEAEDMMDKAIEKYIPQDVEHEGFIDICPSCKRGLQGCDYGTMYCKFCGQAINWG